MMFSDFVPVGLAAVAVLMVPGMLVVSAAGARGWVLLGASAPASVTLVALAAIATGAIGLPWGIIPVFSTSALLAAVIFAVRLTWSSWPRSRRRRPIGPGASLATTPAKRNDGRPSAGFTTERRRDTSRAAVGVVSVVAAVAVISWRMVQAFGGVENISQTFDNIFHLNAVRYILDTGNASSFRIAGFTASDGASGFYPAAWHDVVSLTQHLTGSSIPAAINGTNVVIAALVWPLSCMLLTTSIFGVRRTVLVATSALVAGFSAFPYLMVDFGVLYPNLLSIALMPACIALLALGLGVVRGIYVHRGAAWLMLFGCLPGLALAHPSTLLALLAWTYPVVLGAVAMLARRRRHQVGKRKIYIALLIGLTVYTGMLALAWKKLRPDEAQSTWEPVQTLSQALGQAVTSAPQGGPIPWLIFALTLMGIWALLRQRRHLWLLGMYTISVAMFVVVSGYPFGPFRTFVGGIWYNDPFRPAALLPVAALPVAVRGAIWLAESAISGMSGSLRDVLAGWLSPLRSPLVSALVALLAIGGLLGLSQRGAVTSAVQSAAANYAVTPDSPLLSSDERVLLERVGHEVPADDIVVSSPWTGASLVYALADRKSLTPHIFGDYDSDTMEILRRLNQAGEDPSVCKAVRHLKANYILDFGTREIHGGKHPYSGLENLATDPDVELIDSQGEAKLYRVVACR